MNGTHDRAGEGKKSRMADVSKTGEPSLWPKKIKRRSILHSYFILCDCSLLSTGGTEG